jgi:hypothetical protein
MEDKIIEIHYLVDEFCKEFEAAKAGHVLPKNTSKKNRERKFKMSYSEVITIFILFHLGQFRNFKHFYINYVQKLMQDYFPSTVSYNRFIRLQQKVLIPMTVFHQVCCLGKCTGISFIDSTPIRECHIRRENKIKYLKESHKKESAQWAGSVGLNFIS